MIDSLRANQSAGSGITGSKNLREKQRIQAGDPYECSRIQGTVYSGMRKDLGTETGGEIWIRSKKKARFQKKQAHSCKIFPIFKDQSTG